MIGVFSLISFFCFNKFPFVHKQKIILEKLFCCEHTSPWKQINIIVIITSLSRCKQKILTAFFHIACTYHSMCTKKLKSDSLGLVDIAVWPADFTLQKIFFITSQRSSQSYSTALKQWLNAWHCLVPQNIHTFPKEGILLFEPAPL